MSHHKAKFTWGVGPEQVFVAGNFNNWSGDASPLVKQPDGSFAGDLDVPWGEKQAFKYVVDGEWKVREDEAKEWDAAGNMNNVYTAPAKDAPAATSTDTATSTSPKTLLSSAAPAAASGAAVGGVAAVAGSHAAGTTAAPLGAAPTTTTTTSSTVPVTEKSTATAAVPVAEAPAKTDPTPVKIEKTAANANVGEAPAASTEPTIADKAEEIAEKAAEYGAGAAAALGAAIGGVVVAAEKALGVDVTDSQPKDQMSLEEAKAKGIDVDALNKTDAPTDATSPAGTKPPVGGAEALEEKARELKLDNAHETVGPTAAGATGVSAVPLPKTEPPKSSTADIALVAPPSTETGKHDIPAQDETGANHQTIPAPQITPITAADPAKDRTLNGATSGINSDTAGTKPISSDPAVSANEAKKEAEQHPATTGSTPAAAQGKTTDTTTSITAPAATTDTTTSTTTPATGVTSNAGVAAPSGVATPTPAAPVTPAKKTTTAASTPAAGSTTSTPAKDGERKRKTSIFKKMKEAFSSPKDKEKK